MDASIQRYSVSPCIEGFIAPGYEPVIATLRTILKPGYEDKVQVCAYVDGERVVDLVGRTASSKNKDEYNHDSLQNVFSSSKAVSSVVLAMLVDRKLVTYDTPIAEIWPEFGEKEKHNVTVSDLLCHQSGLSKFAFTIVAPELRRENIKSDSIGDRIANEEVKHPIPRAYHALTRGFVENEIVRRIDPQKRTIGEILRDEIALPLQLDGHITMGAETALHAERVVPLVRQPLHVLLYEICNLWNRSIKLFSLLVYMFLMNVSCAYSLLRGLFGPKYTRSTLVLGEGHPEFLDVVRLFNHPLTREAEIPSANMHASARALAKVASVLAHDGAAHGVQLLSEQTSQVAQGGLRREYDEVLYTHTTFSKGGWCHFDDPKLAGDRQGSMGWFGLGGSAIQWHSEMKVGFGYTCNMIKADLQNGHSALVQRAVLDCARRQKEQKEQKEQKKLGTEDGTGVDARGTCMSNDTNVKLMDESSGSNSSNKVKGITTVLSSTMNKVYVDMKD
jgi:CubicO group peptidase (beta-lactamase class C family)